MRKKKKYVDPLNSLEHSGRRVADPERLLFAAVIAQAVVDATQVRKTKQRDQARSVIFSSVDVTAEHFALLCDYAGIEPGFVVRFTREAIEAGLQLPRNAVSRALSLGFEDE